MDYNPTSFIYIYIYILGHNRDVQSKNYKYQLGIHPPIPEPEEKTI